MNQLVLAALLFPAAMAYGQHDAPIATNVNAPASLSDAEHCLDGSCSASASILSPEEQEQVDIDQYQTHLLQTITPPSTEELHETLSSSITLQQKHMERSLLSNIAFPQALSNTLSKAGNYTDGTKAGTPSWVGDEGAQPDSLEVEQHSYGSFGSVLHVAGGSSSDTNSNSMMTWLASLLHRKSIIASNEDSNKPCRTDLLDDWDSDYVNDVCLVGVTMDTEFVSVSTSERARRSNMAEAAKLDILEMGTFLVNNDLRDWLNMDNMENTNKFDTIFAESIVSPPNDSEDEDNNEVPPPVPMHDMDLVIEQLINFLKPGGTLYMIGKQDHIVVENEEATLVYSDMVNVLDAVKRLSHETPKHDLPATWVHRTTTQLGLNVYTSTLFPIYHSFDDMISIIEEAKDWIDDLETLDKDAQLGFYSELFDLYQRVEGIMGDDTDDIFAGGYEYIIAAQLPIINDDESSLLPKKPVTTATVNEPSEYEYKEKYTKDQDPSVEKLAMPPIKPGELQLYQWDNGDAYDGASARIGIPPKLSETIRDYVKQLGIWDLMINTINNNPMPKNSTRFYTMKSPYEEGKTFTWSAKRPDNFYGSDSDMHWFDVADEASHEESLRVLSKGGYDDVLNAIGTFLGLEHIATFGIGLLAVTKADKGYIHVDFSNSGKRAFNFLINLQTPGDDPELTVIEEDELGNRRRGQVKYAPEFGVLNGDDAMHATNECNHRASGGVRITASIFIAELQQESLYEVAHHDKYYFPFGNMDWIWAQRGRHWNKEGTVSLVEDKGRESFEAEDEMEGCEEKVGENKEKCLVHGAERMLCYKTCGAFIPDDKFKPGEERRTIVGW